MEAHRFASNSGSELVLDICYPCQGLWLDRHENLRLAPESVVELFRLLHAHPAEHHHPPPPTMACPRCLKTLTKGFDVVRSGRYITYRCPGHHGRFSPFSSFMVEKGFVRHMTRVEINDLAQRVGAIYCTSCGAPVDIRKDHACPYCRAAFSLIDPEAVVRAMEGYAQANARAKLGGGTEAGQNPALDIGDALVSLERERTRAEREKQRSAFSAANRSADGVTAVDLLAVGVAAVWGLLKN
ncbi:MAG: hypothetical protein Q7U45_03030 [Burkholderiaceae bacterium]|nr:hypothetical protein [Burkholderiaceae bacterium]